MFDVTNILTQSLCSRFLQLVYRYIFRPSTDYQYIKYNFKRAIYRGFTDHV